jgi:HAD superfamily hydrolase (TIGR01509 family)
VIAGRPSLVIFDCDGVLIDSERSASRVFADALSDLGLAIGADQCRTRYTGMSFRDCLADVEASLGRPVPDGWLAELRTRTFKTLEREAVAIPHALESVGRVHAAGLALCVASSSNPDYLERFLGKTGFAPFFGKNVFSSKMVARGKPAPDLFLHAAARMNSSPRDCVVIEDSLPGVRGAVAAGMRVIGYVGEAESDGSALAASGAEIIRDMREVPRRVGIAH